MRKKIVITGVNGFVGKHLASELSQEGHEVIGVGMDTSPSPEIAEHLSQYLLKDLSKEWPDVSGVDAIVHLAGLAAVDPSFEHPQDYLNINSAMMTNMCEYYLKQDKKPRIVMISSGAIYDPNEPMPIAETSKVVFTSPYSVSKVLLENQAAYYLSRGIDCVVMRPFNHIGPGQAPGFLVPDLAEKILSRANASDPIKVGDLATKRDYTDVRDVATAYRLVATSVNKPKHLVYNVCSGVSHTGEEVLDIMSGAMNIEKPDCAVDQAFIRPNDIMDIRGDNTRLREEFGWETTYEFAQTIADFVEFQAK
jgi:GDP-4-dehydro-6-deoxy-D-mannose reductase